MIRLRSHREASHVLFFNIPQGCIQALALSALTGLQVHVHPGVLHRQSSDLATKPV